MQLQTSVGPVLGPLSSLFLFRTHTLTHAFEPSLPSTKGHIHASHTGSTGEEVVRKLPSSHSSLPPSASPVILMFPPISRSLSRSLSVSPFLLGVGWGGVGGAAFLHSRLT